MATSLDALTAGRDALHRGAWAEARTHLESGLASDESPEALEELGLAAWWLDDAATVFDARERAYAQYRERDDARGAARVAIWLVWDNLSFRGDFAVASGWLERSRRLLADHSRAPEFGWLLVREGEVALFRGHDPAAAIDRAQMAGALARDIGDQSIEFTALALEGLARVSIGDVEGGMRCLDEATLAATAGEVKELHAVSVVCCWQIFACERVRDYERAAQWCARVREFTRRWDIHVLSAVCRTHYAGVLVWRGEWARAEAELTESHREMERIRPGMTRAALVGLGDLRLRQGMLDDAERLFSQAGSNPLARVGLAAIMIERGNSAEAAALLEQILLQIGDGEATLRTTALELLVRADATLGQLDDAERHATELATIASRLGTDALTASIAVARAAIARQRGDHAAAALCLERGAEYYERSGAPFETARARMELSRAYAALDRVEAAEREERLAAAAFHSLGVRRPKGNALLTARQIEILRLVARGMSNADIARQLDLSEHTVKRHVANLLTKLDLSSRTAAAAYAAREGLV